MTATRTIDYFMSQQKKPVAIVEPVVQSKSVVNNEVVFDDGYEPFIKNIPGFDYESLKSINYSDANMKDWERNLAGQKPTGQEGSHIARNNRIYTAAEQYFEETMFPRSYVMAKKNLGKGYLHSANTDQEKFDMFKEQFSHYFRDNTLMFGVVEHEHKIMNNESFKRNLNHLYYKFHSESGRFSFGTGDMYSMIQHLVLNAMIDLGLGEYSKMSKDEREDVRESRIGKEKSHRWSQYESRDINVMETDVVCFNTMIMVPVVIGGLIYGFPTTIDAIVSPTFFTYWFIVALSTIGYWVWSLYDCVRTRYDFKEIHEGSWQLFKSIIDTPFTWPESYNTMKSRHDPF